MKLKPKKTPEQATLIKFNEYSRSNSSFEVIYRDQISHAFYAHVTNTGYAYNGRSLCL